MAVGVTGEALPASPGHSRQKRGVFPPEVLDLIRPPLKVGLWSGIAGAFTGVGVAVVKDVNVFLSGASVGVESFAIGSIYWFARTVLLRAQSEESQTKPMNRIGISALAGSAGGAVSGLMRGPSRILPVAIAWGVIGAGGQMVADRITSRKTVKERSIEEGWFRSKWSPIKRLTDDEYIELMEEKVLIVKADIALIDEKIAALKEFDEKMKQKDDAQSKP